MEIKAQSFSTLGPIKEESPTPLRKLRILKATAGHPKKI
jgi:hypothetical protein